MPASDEPRKYPHQNGIAHVFIMRHGSNLPSCNFQSVVRAVNQAHGPIDILAAART